MRIWVAHERGQRPALPIVVALLEVGGAEGRGAGSAICAFGGPVAMLVYFMI